MRYKIEIHEANLALRTLHTDEIMFNGWFGPHYKFSDYDKLSDFDREFVDELIAVPGVKKLYFHPYECSVEKGGVFSWDEVFAPILRIFERRYGELEDVSSNVPRSPAVIHGPAADDGED